MIVAGVLVLSSPNKAADVERELTTLPGVEVHAVEADGRMVVTIEGDDQNTITDTFRCFNDLSGVMSTALVYHHFESDCGQEI